MYFPTLSGLNIEYNQVTNDSTLGLIKTHSNLKTQTQTQTNYSINNTPIVKPISANSNIINLNSPTYEGLSHNLSNSSLESYFSIEDLNSKSNFKKNLSCNIHRISYYEENNIFNRQILNNTIDNLFKQHTELENLVISDINNEKSWFSLLWTPKSTNYGSNEVSFLVIYRFRNKISNGSLKTLSIIGIIANKIDEDNQLFWFANPNANNVYDFKVQDEFMRSKSNYLFYSVSNNNILTIIGKYACFYKR